MNKECLYFVRLQKTVLLWVSFVYSIPPVKLFWVNQETKILICEIK